MTTHRLLTTLSLLITFLLSISFQNLHAAAGDLDHPDVSINGTILTTVLQPDGKILVGGSFTSAQGVTRNRIARINPDGTLDNGFNPNANSTVESIVVQADGKIIIGGFFTSLQPDAGVPSVTRNRIARLNPDGTLDTGFNPNANAEVLSMAEQTDGKIVIVGRFTSLQPNGATSVSDRNRIARLNADGTLDTAFNAPIYGNGGAYSLAIQADGKILVVGSFSSVAGAGRGNIARLNANGTIDATFNPNASAAVNSIAVQADGKILVGGEFNVIANNVRSGIARLNANGTVDTGFNPNANNRVYSMALQADGRILIAGHFTTLKPVGSATAIPRNYIARLEPNGTLDMGFDPKADNHVNCVALQADGGILLGGSFTTLQPNGSGAPVPQARFARLQNDPATRTLTVPTGNQVLLTSGGSAPEFVRVGFQLSTDGGDTWTFLGAGAFLGASGGWRLYDLALPAAGMIRALGVTSDGNGSTGGIISSVASFNNPPALPKIAVFTGGSTAYADERASGATAPQFPSTAVGITSVAQTFTIRNTGLAPLTGLALSVTGTNPGDFTPGMPQATLAPGATTTFTVAFSPTVMGVRSAVVNLVSNDTDKSPFIINLQGTATAATNANLSALGLSAGVLTPAFDPAVTTYSTNLPYEIKNLSVTPVKAEINAGIAVQIHGGDFIPASSGSPSDPLPLKAGLNEIVIRVTAQNGRTVKTYNVTVFRTGAVQGSLDPLMADSGVVITTVTQPDGKIILAGDFESVAGIPRGHIARLNVDGTVDTSFNPTADNVVRGVALQPDGKILICGWFTSLKPEGATASTARNRLARLNADGSVDAGFDPNPNESVHCMVLRPDGRLLIGGDFTTLQPNGAATGTVRNRIAQLNADGTLDAGFDPNVNDSVCSVVRQPDGKVLLGGYFTTIQPNGAASAISRNNIARVNEDGSLDTTFDPNANSRILCMLVQPDGKILLGGDFATLQPNGAATATTRNRIARLNADGTLDTGFNPNADYYVSSMTMEVNGRILICGGFSWLQPNDAGSATRRNKIARLNPDGTLDIDFDPNPDSDVLNVAQQADGKVLLGGGFSALYPNGSVEGFPRRGFARIINDPATQQLTVPDATRIRWMRGGSSPEVEQVTFEISTDNGTSYTLLGAGTRINGGWQLTDLSLPGGLIRARGRTSCGWRNGSAGMMQTIITYGVSPEPEISVSGNSVAITNGSVVPSTADNTDFGTVTVSGIGSTRSLSFMISNTGAAGLAVGNVTISGADAADFTVLHQPAPTVAGGDSTSFTILFDPSATGPREAVVSFTNGDGDEGSFQFNIHGTGFISNDADLVSLHPSVGMLDPVFSADTLSYSTSVAFGQTSIAVTPVQKETNASIRVRVNGESYVTVASGISSDDLNLIVGSNTIEVRVTAQDGVTVKTYTVTVTRRPMGPGDLDSLVANPGGSLYDFGTTSIYATAIQPDGRIIIAGNFTSVQSVPRNGIARLHADGSLDRGFDPGADGYVFCLAVQADGKIILGGRFTTLRPNGAANPTNRGYIARLNADGTLDQDFHAAANADVRSLAIQADEKIIMGGYFTTVHSSGSTGGVRNRIARLNPDGTVDPVFNPTANAYVSSVVVQSDGKVLLGGYFTTLQPNGSAVATTRNRIARVNADGTLDQNFDPGVNSVVNSVLVQPDGKILLGGDFGTFLPPAMAPAVRRNGMARLHSDGTLDMDFDPNFHGRVYCMALQADHGILVGGGFIMLTPNGADISTNRSFIARLQADGNVDPGFNPGADGNVFCVAQQTDGQVLFGGGFNKFQPNAVQFPVSRVRIARIINSPATQTLEVPDATQVTWTRGGSSPEVSHVTLELSTDGGKNYTPLGKATRVGTTADWRLTGLNLPTGGLLRARGRMEGFGTSLVETVTAFGNASTPLAAWRQSQFGSPANTGNGADNADSDHDGLANLIEYAFGLDPKAPDAHQLPQPLLVGGDLTATFTPPAGTGGITYGAQWSENLTDWHPAADMNTTPQRTFSVPMADRKKLYMRLTVTAP
ncbi:choice-of-anchor D domain-containing protein [Luteolibacter yonseiensis]|uniref:Choice-of-anchor D domain-containing protein n=1 Tax=Luteolibacter yonseiensis TaxID=1144680 RepID=A0A934R935_9BACT|nr:choice-of-anchor D domain-containing protein [Luteolibacter yonseiensis]MBK1817309.1 choice-of-anchor D domain-containing protein [Luteolibacter yonseiensis]